MSIMNSQQFVVGKDIDFEFSGSGPLQKLSVPVTNEAGPSNPHKKKKRKKKKKKTSTKAQVRLHADGQGLTIDNIDATMESDLLEAANTVAQSLGSSMEYGSPVLRRDSLKWSLDRLEMVANRSKKSPFWDLSRDQKHQIHNFWINLSEAERRDLLRLEKEREDVLRIDKKLSETKHRQIHKSCSCSGCGRKQNTWKHRHEGEMEKIYDEYSAELELIADCFTKGMFTEDNETTESANESHNLADENTLSSAEFETGPADYFDEEDIQEEAELLAEMTAERRKIKGNRLGGGILSVADDLLQNDGKRFVDVMEQMAEYKVVREIDMAARHDAAAYIADQNHLRRGDYSDLEEDEFDDEDDDDLDCDEHEDDEDDLNLHAVPFNSSTGDVAKVMLRGFATRTFEYRVLLAFREHVAKQRQMSLFAELEAEEARVREEKEQKKLRDREKRKDKKRAQQKLKEEERARKEQERKAKEEAQRAKEEAARLARLEEQRLKQEAHRIEIEERLKKLALEEERERQHEKERKEKERQEEEQREHERLKAEAEAEAETRKYEQEHLEAERLERKEQQELIERQRLINEQALQEEAAATTTTELPQPRHETPLSSDWTSGTQDEEVRGWSPLGGIYQTSTPLSRASVGSVNSQWPNWPLGSTSPMSMSIPIGTGLTRTHVGGSLWSGQSIWSTCSLDSVQNAALLSYDRLVFEGAAVDGYIPSQVLYQATIKSLGNSMLSQTDFYNACGTATNSGPFFCLRDSVGIVTHLRRK